MYSAEQIAYRRQVKYRTLDALCDMAIIGRMGIRTLWRDEPLELSTRLTTYWLAVRDDDPAKETLRTAKGCVGKPDDAVNQDTVLLEFLRDHAAGARAQSCGQNFAKDCALWAAQLAGRNPGNATLAARWRTRSAELDQARAEAEGEYRAFYGRPDQRAPRTPEEAKYLLVWSRHLDGMTRDNYEPMVEGLEETFPNQSIDRLTWERAGAIQPTAFAPLGGA